MLVRIVKMSFIDAEIPRFLENFDKNKEKIRNSKGCRLLELYRNKQQPNQFFSYSYWDSEEHLNAYRSSELFKGIWSVTKKMFNDKPEAWSLTKEERL